VPDEVQQATVVERDEVTVMFKRVPDEQTAIPAAPASSSTGDGT
jgi:hypothetical protein